MHQAAVAPQPRRACSPATGGASSAPRCPSAGRAPPDEIGGLATFLAGRDDYVVAQRYNIDGGDWMS